MKQATEETRGRPRDTVYGAVCAKVIAKAKSGKKNEYGFRFDISNKVGMSPKELYSRYLGFRQSTTFKETVRQLGANGWRTRLFFDNEEVIIRIEKEGR